ncbi:MAG: hypothetical protein LC674_02495 [Actinobacteria bacterium]|nr:hypothetical protein [Actinomycetota bacterium]
MAHISELALLEYVAGKADLTTEEQDHLQECDECQEGVIRMRRTAGLDETAAA